MGAPTDTQTQLRHRFLARYGEFRKELPRQEQAIFDELLLIACRHATALNRKADMDFERPMILTMLLGEAARHAETRQQLARMNAEVVLLREAMKQHGILLPA